MIEITGRIFQRQILRCMRVPKSALGVKPAPVRMPVIVRIGRDRFESTLLPLNARSFLLVVPLAYLRERGLDAGDALTIGLAIDANRGAPELPADVERYFCATAGALDDYRAVTVALQREIVRYIEAAKTEAARARRIAEVAERIREIAARRRTKERRD